MHVCIREMLIMKLNNNRHHHTACVRALCRAGVFLCTDLRVRMPRQIMAVECGGKDHPSALEAREFLHDLKAHCR